MNPRRHDHLAPAAIRGSSLRGVSRVLGMSGLSVLALAAAQANPVSGETKRKKRKTKNRRKRKPTIDARCKQQTSACEALITSKCTVELDDPACQDRIACCAHLEQCRMAEFVSCLEEAGTGALGAA